MKKFAVSIALVAVALGMTACGEKQTVSFDTLEAARQVAKANSEFNAQLYKAANPRFTGDYAIIARSDDSQEAKCPQGDGWAELSIMKVEQKQVDKTVLMCSTYSSSVGCYRKDDFDKLPNLAGQNGTCRKDIPFPLPVLKK